MTEKENRQIVHLALFRLYFELEDVSLNEFNKLIQEELKRALSQRPDNPVHPSPA